MSLPIERYVPSPYVIFKKKPISDVCEHGFVEYFYSKNDPKTGTLEFVVEGNADHLIVPSKIFLKLEMELSGSAATKKENEDARTVGNGKATVGVINNIFHSVFESVEVLVSNQAITKTDRNYPYNAMLQTLCNYGQEAYETYFELTGWSKDTAGHMEDMGEDNDGFQKRREFFRGIHGKAEFIGKICSPIFFQEKVLPTQVALKVILRKAADQFFLKHEAGDFGLTITNAVLMVQKVKTVSGLRQSYLELLEEGNSIPYFLKSPTMTPFSIEASTSSFTRDNLFLGKVPRRIVIGMVETLAYHGRRDKNPFNFRHFGLREIGLYKDGTPYPRPLVKLDMENHECAEAYHNFMSSLNGAYSRNVPSITMSEYKEGYTLFSYDMSPDQMGSIHPGSMLNMNSNIRLEMKFEKPVSTNITLLVYSEYDHLMEIHRDRRVTIDY